MIRDLAKSLDDTDELLAADIRKFLTRVKKAGWKTDAVKKHTQWLIARHYGRAERNTIHMVEDAASYAEDYVRRIGELSPMHYRPLPASEIKFLTGNALGNVDAAKSLVYGRSAAAKAPYKGVLRLSRRLHTLSGDRARKVSSYVVRAIREAQNVGYASRELVELGGLGRKAKLPKLLEELREAASGLNRWAQGELQPQIRRLEKYIKGINEGGTVGKAYRELIDSLVKQRRLGKGVPGEAVEKSIGRWVHYKERYFAERIIETETNAAFRASQVAQSNENPGLIGYIWHLSRTSGREFGCQCETLDGKTLKPKEAEGLIGGVHPFCSCYLEEIWDYDKILTQFD
jgi:hypothetical protein